MIKWNGLVNKKSLRGKITMRIEQLKYLLVMEKETSLNAAAEKLYISHQALGKSIKALEEEFNIKLIEKSYQGYVFTEDGQKVVDFARKTYKEYVKLMKEFNSFAQKEQSKLKGLFKIYSNIIYSISILPPIIEEFHEDHPMVQINSKSVCLSKVLELMAEDDENNACIGLINIASYDLNRVLKEIEEKGLIFHKICDSKIKFYCSKNYHLAKKERISVSTIWKEPMVRFMDENESWEVSLGSKRKVAITTTSYNVWLNTIIRGAGVGVLSDIALIKGAPFSSDVEKVENIKTREKLTSSLGAVIKRNDSPIVQEFVKYFKPFEKNN